jgi:taurine dioxygenase
MVDLGQLKLGPRRFLDAMRDEITATPYERITVRPLGVTIGAEIEGVDLREPLDDATFAEVERAHRDYKAIFFRDQDITTPQQIAFARRFGELEEHPFLPSREGHDDVVRFEKNDYTVGAENVWHSDVSFRERPALAALLRAREIPPVGGDTLFADMVAAYAGLDDDVKARIDGRVAVHDFAQSYGLYLTPEQLEEKRREFPSVEHPVVRTHPATGKKILYVNAIFTSHIVGMEREESNRLLDILVRQAAVPEYQCRFRWQKNSVAFWDNRAVQHYAVSDYWPAKRVVERVAIIGERPA